MSASLTENNGMMSDRQRLRPERFLHLRLETLRREQTKAKKSKHTYSLKMYIERQITR